MRQRLNVGMAFALLLVWSRRSRLQGLAFNVQDVGGIWARVEGLKSMKSVAKTSNHYVTDIQVVVHENLSFEVCTPTSYVPDAPRNPSLKSDRTPTIPVSIS